MNSREWINLHREDLRKKFTDKTVIVSGNKVIETLDGVVNPLVLNKKARHLHLKDWSYTYLPKGEEEYLFGI